MDKKIKYGIVGLLAVLIAGSGSVFLTPDEFSHAYYCPLTDQVAIFYGGVSSSGLTGYPYAENRSGYKRCTYNGVKGQWIKLGVYAEENNISIQKLFNNLNRTLPQKVRNIRKYNCNQFNCTEIK